MAHFLKKNKFTEYWWKSTIISDPHYKELGREWGTKKYCKPASLLAKCQFDLFQQW